MAVLVGVGVAVGSTGVLLGVAVGGTGVVGAVGTKQSPEPLQERPAKKNPPPAAQLRGEVAPTHRGPLLNWQQVSGVGVGVRVGVLVIVGVRVGVSVGVLVGVSVPVLVGVLVGV